MPRIGVFYVLTNNVSGPGAFAGLLLDTAPEKVEAMFVECAGVGERNLGNFTLNTAVVRYSSGTTTAPPLSRWLRWRISGFTGAWTITMRIVVAFNPSNYAPHLLGNPGVAE